VPLARYVLEHAGKLEFPLRRYQIQKCWRGERPQEGRYREFTQADIDVIGRDELGFDADVEVTEVMAEALSRLPLPPVTLQVNNRKLIEGFYLGIGAEDPATGDPSGRQARQNRRGGKFADRCATRPVWTPPRWASAWRLAEISSADASFTDAVLPSASHHPLLDPGPGRAGARARGSRPRTLGALRRRRRPQGGTADWTTTRARCSRDGWPRTATSRSARADATDALASDGRTPFPGVGISLGVTRVLAPLMARGLIDADRSVPSCVLVALPTETTGTRPGRSRGR
jgi:histidyl-tRNA synthetase